MDKKKITNMEVKKKNRNEVFRYICKQGTVSNPDIAYNMKISLPTATQITKELIAEGLLEEKGELQSTDGRSWPGPHQKPYCFCAYQYSGGNLKI